MAKKKETNLGLILSLVFFVLTTLILGLFTYFVYEEHEDLTKKAADAATKESEARRLLEEEHAKLIANRIAMGTNSDDDLRDMQGLVSVHRQVIQDEVAALQQRLGGALPTGQFVWALDGGQPAARPAQTLPELVNLYYTDMVAANQARDQALQARDKALQDLTTERDQRVADKRDFDAEIDALNAEKEAIEATKTQAFITAVDEAKQKGADAGQARRDAQNLVDAKDREIRALQTQVAEQQVKIDNYESERKPPEVDLNKPRGEIVRREKDIVYINLGSADGARPQLTFSVFPQRREILGAAAASGNVRVDLSGQVEVLGADTNDIPNDLKGAIEIIDVIGPSLATARVTYEMDPIRDPIRGGDQLFNPAWEPGYREHIAFAGIIDLNADGVDDNEQFIRLLERHGVVVDAYLDLKTREIKGPGMSIDTTYLVRSDHPDLNQDLAVPGAVNANDPRRLFKDDVLVKMGEMDVKAKDLGIQTMSARKFLAYMGIEMPRVPVPPDYAAGEYLRAAPRPEPEQPGLPPLLQPLGR